MNMDKKNIEENDTKEINVDELFDGKINNTLIIDPITKEETFLEPKKSSLIIILFLIIIISLCLYYIYMKTNFWMITKDVIPQTTTMSTSASSFLTTSSTSNKKNGIINCIYENKNDNETINSTIEINFKEDLVISTKFKLDVTSNKNDLENTTLLKNDYENLYINNSSLFLDKINFTNNENNFSLLIDTDYSLINLDNIAFEENKNYLYLKPVKNETYEDIKLKYEAVGYVCNYLINEE